MRTDRVNTNATTTGAQTKPSTEALLARAADLPAEDTRRARLIEEVVRRHAWLTRALASRYTGRGEDFEVLHQEANVALMEAVQRFDPERGTFLPFVRVTIIGLLRRHFRDRRRWMQIPRRLQDVQAGIRAVGDELTQTLGHEPSPSEFAARLDASEADVEAAGAASFRPLSLDMPAGSRGDSDIEPDITLGDQLGDEDGNIDKAVDLEAVRTIVTELPLRERKILLLRFYGDLTQREIADQIHVSQMHISRLIHDACLHIRDRVLEDQQATIAATAS
jgi:RNA polymerase sigma-B factor